MLKSVVAAKFVAKKLEMIERGERESELVDSELRRTASQPVSLALLLSFALGSLTVQRTGSFAQCTTEIPRASQPWLCNTLSLSPSIKDNSRVNSQSNETFFDCVRGDAVGALNESMTSFLYVSVVLSFATL